MAAIFATALAIAAIVEFVQGGGWVVFPVMFVCWLVLKAFV